MKKIIVSIFLILICYIGFGQTYPTQQNIGASSTLVKTPNYGGLQGGLVPYTFSDTSAANTALTYLKNYCGAFIYTTDVAAVWYRSCYLGSNKWVQILPAGGAGGAYSWNVGGNSTFLGSAVSNEILGTLVPSKGIDFYTNNLSRLILPSTGIVRSSGAANKCLTFDTTTKILYYTDCGSGGGGGSTITSLGSGYAVGVTGTNNVKSLSAGWGAILDSATTGQVGVTVDSNAVKGLQLTMPISSLIAATGSNSIDNGNYDQEWQWNTLTGTGLSLTSNSTVATTGHSLFRAALTGANANSGQTTVTQIITNSHTGTSSTNVGLRVAASGGTINTAIHSVGGNVLIAPTAATTPSANDSLLTVEEGIWGKRGLRLSNLPSGVGTKSLRIDASGNVTSADTTAGGGGTAENIIDSMNYIDVNRDYNVYPNDGIDDAAGIQAALNAAALSTATRVTLYFSRPGVYNIDGALVTSVDGINPNCQLYIPLNIASDTNYKRIKILGSASPYFLTSGIGGTNQLNYGVVFKSGIIGSGTLPSVIGASYYNDVPFGNFNYTTVDLDNITIVTRTKTAGVDITPTMTAVNFGELTSATVGMNGAVKIITESTAGTSAAGTGTAALIMPGINNRALVEVGDVNINGYEDGIIISEHFVAKNIVLSHCVNGVVVRTGYQGNYVGSMTVEACANVIEILDNQDIAVSNYKREKVTTGAWYDFVQDINFAGGTGRVTILHAQPVISSVGDTTGLVTNDHDRLDMVSVWNTPKIFFNKNNKSITPYSSGGGTLNAIRLTTNSNQGYAVNIQNNHASGAGLLAFLDNGATIKGSIGYNNSTSEFKYDAESGLAHLFKVANTDIFRINSTGAKVIDGSAATPSISATANSATGISFYNGSGSAADMMKVSASTTGAVMAIQNNNSGGYSGIEYLDNTGAQAVFTGLQNSNNQFRFNNFATAGTIVFKISGADAFLVNNNRSLTAGFYGAGTATFDASGNISSVSDTRLKKNIKPYNSGVKELMRLRPIQYSWNDKSGMETNGTYAGFSAQNVKDAIPLGTGENKDGYLSLQERAIIATLVNAAQEQQKEIEKLKKEIKKLKKRK